MSSVVDLLVEGDIDQAVAERILEYVGLSVGQCYGKHGWTYIRQKIEGFNAVADYQPYLVLIDLMDTGIDCPAKLAEAWLPARKEWMFPRAVVREIESWLLADAEGIAQLLSISPAVIPQEPESIQDPKQELINLARRCKKKTLRDALVPKEGTATSIGPLYTSEMTRFIKNQWDVEKASQNAPSLHRCIERLRTLKQ